MIKYILLLVLTMSATPKFSATIETVDTKGELKTQDTEDIKEMFEILEHATDKLVKSE